MNYFPQGTDTQCIVNSYVSKECERNRDTKKVMGKFNSISWVYRLELKLTVYLNLFSFLVVKETRKRT